MRQFIWQILVDNRGSIFRVVSLLVLVMVSFSAGREWGLYEDSYRVETRVEARCDLEKKRVEDDAVMFCAAIVGPLETRLRVATKSLSSCNSVKDATYETCRRVWGVQALAKGRKPQAALGGGPE